MCRWCENKSMFFPAISRFDWTQTAFLTRFVMQTQNNLYLTEGRIQVFRYEDLKVFKVWTIEVQICIYPAIKKIIKWYSHQWKCDCNWHAISFFVHNGQFMVYGVQSLTCMKHHCDMQIKTCTIENPKVYGIQPLNSKD